MHYRPLGVQIKEDVMNNEDSKPKIKLYVVLAIVATLFIGVFWFVWNYSFIEVSVEGASNGTNLKITNQSNNQSSSLELKTKTTKKMLRKGDYQISASQTSKSGMSIANSTGFLRTTKTTVTLEGENARQFVGNNPSPCMYFTGVVLASYECSDIAGLTLHQPATAQTPTVNLSVEDFSYQYPQGMVRTKEGTVILTRLEAGEANPEKSIAVFLLDDNLQISKEALILDFDPDKTYSIKTYKDGFIVHSTTSNDGQYFASIDAKPQSVTLGKPKDSTLKPGAWSASGSQTAIAFSNNTEGEKADLDNDNPGKVKTEVVVNKDGKDSRFTIEVNPTSMLFCGTDKLCLLNEKVVDVYSLATDEPSFMYRVSGIDDIFPDNKNILLAKSDGIWLFNPDSATGHMSYSFSNNYTYCGAQETTNGFSVCLINNQQKKVGLFVDTTKPDNGSIDKKIASLQSMSDVLNISAYKNFLYISPNAGTVTTQLDDGYGLDEAKLAKSKAAITKKIQELGIDPAVYTIIFTL